MTLGRKRVLEVLERDLSRPASFRELARTLGLRQRSEREQLKATLRTLARNGEVVRIKGGRFGLPRRMNLVVGTLKCSPKGFGFVSPARSGVPDVFVRQVNMGGALHGDEVVARVEHRKSDGRTEGRIIRILERSNTKLIGRLERGKNYDFVSPLEPKILTDVIVSPADASSVEEGVLVEVEILEHPSGHRPASGRVVEVVGYPTDPGIDLELVIRRCQLPREFPSAVRRAASRLAAEPSAEDTRGRTDFRGQTIVTIDGEKAQDFDDAVGVTRTGANNWLLGIHIADVSHYVQPDTALDQEATSRGTSIYFPGKVIPMLPEALSNGICSLNPGVDRLTLSLLMVLAPDGELVDHSFHRGVIHSRERLTYHAVQQMLVDRDPELLEHYAAIRPDLESMAELARLLAERRRQRGSIDFDLPESEIVLNLEGAMTGIRRSERLFSHDIIEEFMILANEVVAQTFVERDLPCIYRVHEPPGLAEVEALNESLKLFGHQVERYSPRSFREVMEAVRGRPEERFVNTVCLRSMKLARYQTANVEHYGLASTAYAHFTSPIRRYPDLVLHRLVKEALLGSELTPGRREELRTQLEAVAEESSRLERRAQEAEREYVERKKVRFMADKIGELYSGTITAVQSFGFFVELDEFFVEGLVHLTSLHDDYYNHDERGHRLVGETTGRTFQLGSRVSVQVAHVDLMRRYVDFKLLDVPGSEPA